MINLWWTYQKIPKYFPRLKRFLSSLKMTVSKEFQPANAPSHLLTPLSLSNSCCMESGNCNTHHQKGNLLILHFAYMCIWFQIKNQLIFTIQLISLLFMSFTALFSTIYKSHCTISTNFIFIYSTFNKKFLISVK